MLKLTNLTLAGLMVAATFAAIPASAAPFGPVKAGISTDSTIVKVRDGCGPHRFRGRWGHCRWL